MAFRSLVCVALISGVVAAGCGGSGGGGDGGLSEHQLLEQTRATLARSLPGAIATGGTFPVPGPAPGICTINVIAVGADAPSYEGFPWTAESPDGEVAIKTNSSEGALTEDCTAAIKEAMGW